MYILGLGLICWLTLFIPSVKSQAFALDAFSYPTVGDHHCIAWWCNNVHWDSDGYHRDDQSTYQRSRRHAMGCDGLTNCGTGDSCDELPYASTYDGGLGCFAQRWTLSGRSINNLQNHGSHMCVSAHDNSAHGSALGTFYRQQNIANFGHFTVTLEVNNQGCSGSGWCDRFLRAVHGISRETVGQVCVLAGFNGKQYRHITTSQYTNFPKCPSRNYRREEDSSVLPADWIAEELASSSYDAPPNVTTVSPRLARADNGKYHLELFGTLKEGDTIWEHDKSLENGTTAKVAEFVSYENLFKLGHLQRRQRC